MIRIGPILGLLAQLGLLLVLAVTVGLGVAGWLTGVSFGLFVCGALSFGLAHEGAGGLGPADWVTLSRAAMSGGVAALVADSFFGPVPVSVLVAITVVALALDAVDGQVARRTGTASALGARFDMEVDAFLILALSVYVARSAGVWVLAIGVMRYANLVASWILPWMRGPVPPRYWRKVVAAIQGIVLVVAASGVLSAWLVTIALLAALALLIESFGRDIVWFLYG